MSSSIHIIRNNIPYKKMNINLSTLFGLIRISGADAKDFIQNQFSNDITLTTDNKSQISSYNSPKGRVYATFRVVQSENAYLLITTRDQLAFLVKRLSMFVMRSAVKIEDASNDYSLSGIDKAENIATDKPADLHMVAQNEGHICICVQDDDKQQRFIYLSAPDLATADSTETLQDWLLKDIYAGIPHILSGAEEEFVAQMLNLDIIDGINFQKGCYPGQEIIARMKYLGKLKKRMFVISLPAGSETKAGQAIYQANKEQAIGQLVYSAQNEHQHAGLAVLNIDVAMSGIEIYIKSEKGTTPAKVEQSFSDEGATS